MTDGSGPSSHPPSAPTPSAPCVPLGCRTLSLKSPPIQGGDVAELQSKLGALGVHPGPPVEHAGHRGILDVPGDHSGLTLYLNGSRDSEGDSATDFPIRALGLGNAGHMNGALSQVALYDHRWGPDRLLAHHRALSP